MRSRCGVPPQGYPCIHLHSASSFALAVTLIALLLTLVVTFIAFCTRRLLLVVTLVTLCDPRLLLVVTLVTLLLTLVVTLVALVNCRLLVVALVAFVEALCWLELV
jgi:hypothetical protein